MSGLTGKYQPQRPLVSEEGGPGEELWLIFALKRMKILIDVSDKLEYSINFLHHIPSGCYRARVVYSVVFLRAPYGTPLPAFMSLLGFYCFLATPPKKTHPYNDLNYFASLCLFWFGEPSYVACCCPQHALPDLPDGGDVPAPRGVAVGLEDVAQRQAAHHRFQNLLHVAEGEPGLGPDAGLYQLHGAGDQGDLAGTEHSLVHLEWNTTQLYKARVQIPGEQIRTWLRGAACVLA